MTSLIRKISAILALFCIGLTVLAQTTKVRGRVTDADTGEGVPFAGVFFKGTTTGLTTDLDGYYSLETRDQEAVTIVCQLLGYDTQEKAITPGQFNKLDFSMKLTDNRISSSFVKADNHKAKRLLANIDKHRARNNPDSHPKYKVDVYSKIELDLSNVKPARKGSLMDRQFGFIFDYMDTSSVTGKAYLPAMISESVVHRFHSNEPSVDREVVEANRISGINADENLLSQFTGSLHLKVNFYNPFVNAFDVEFPSPIQSAGMLFYNYFIVDSLNIDGRKTLVVRYHPKEGISSPALDGEMKIDAEDFALREVHAKMKKGGNVNWLRDIVIDAEYERQPDSTWFYKTDKLYADFSVTLQDSSKLVSFLGNRTLAYSNPDFDYPVEDIADKSKAKVYTYYEEKDEAYWDANRPYELSQKEKDIYQMVEKVKDAPLFKTAYDIVETCINGYFDIKNIGIGPVFKVLSFNPLEGTRLQMGLRTSNDWSKKDRIGGYVAYGTKDGKFKFETKYEHMFSKYPTRKLTVEAKHDVLQLGRGQSTATDANILALIFTKNGSQKPTEYRDIKADFEHEVTPDLSFNYELVHKQILASEFVPLVRPDATLLPKVIMNEARLMVRWSHEETVNRGPFIKTSVHTNYPILTLNLRGGINGFGVENDNYFRPELNIDWKFRVPPAGMSKIHINAGMLMGQVPYPLLKLHEGNSTYILDKTAFSCMDFFEFASDRWAQIFWHHNLNGFLLGKIPLLRKLNLREEFAFKAAWGALTDKNNGILGEAGNAKILFPEGMKSLEGRPYYEVGVGISNIFRLLRVDSFWRLIHREESRRNFCITIGMEVRF